MEPLKELLDYEESYGITKTFITVIKPDKIDQALQEIIPAMFNAGSNKCQLKVN